MQKKLENKSRIDWAGLIAEQEKSGLSQKEFCNQRGLVLSQFVYHRCSKNKSKTTKAAESALKPVKVISKVNVNQVGELFAVMDDVKAHRGVIICNKGFTQGAKNFAKDRGIDLCHIHDAESKDWKTELKFPVILEEVYPTLSFSVTGWVFVCDDFEYRWYRILVGDDYGRSVQCVADALAI